MKIYITTYKNNYTYRIGKKTYQSNCKEGVEDKSFPLNCCLHRLWKASAHQLDLNIETSCPSNDLTQKLTKRLNENNRIKVNQTEPFIAYYDEGIEITIISASLPFTPLFQEQMRKDKESFLIVKDIEKAREFVIKEGLDPTSIICNYGEIDMFYEAFSSMMTYFYCIKDDVEIQPDDKVHIIDFQTGTKAVIDRYGDVTRQMVTVRNKTIAKTYKLFYKALFKTKNYSLPISKTTELAVNFYLNRAYNDYDYRVWSSLHNLAHEHDTMFTSEQITNLGHGYFNLVYGLEQTGIYKEPRAIRILIGENRFDADGLKALSESTDTGFIPITEFSEEFEYSVIPYAKNIKRFDFDKVKTMLSKHKRFFKSHPNLAYFDYHRGNVMEYEGEYVITDTDLNMVSVEMIEEEDDRDVNQYIDQEVKVAYNPPFTKSFLISKSIPITLTSITMFSIELADMARFNYFLLITKEILDELESRVKADLN